MRSTTTLVVAALAFGLCVAGCSGSSRTPAAGNAPAPPAAPADASAGAPSAATDGSATEATLTLKVSGMTCTGCEAAISGEVGKLAGVTRVKADHKAGTATVTYDPARADLAGVRKAIEKVGYKIEG